jgi:sec-independent protein translocase protein TatA
MDGPGRGVIRAGPPSRRKIRLPEPSGTETKEDPMGLGATEILVILAVVLLLFGSTRLPALARSLGQASSEFKAGIRDKGSDNPDAPAK